MNGPEENAEIFENEQERTRYAEVELALHRGMSRVDAPAGFADRMMERAERAGSQKRSRHAKILTMPMRQWRVWAAGAVAAVIVLGALQGERVHQEHERRAQAQRQFVIAERITDQTLEHTRQQLERAGVSLDGAE
ncbi:MAG TPA: hypothetical protein VHY48_06240 [Acidobacteriaceae bacterium]|nr:hypothetical protein [Acidobacteriaceae bacterium]